MTTNFGLDFEINWPKTVPKYSEFGMNLLKNCANAKPPSPLSIEELKRNSEVFPVQFPIDSCRIKSQPVERESIVAQQAASAYPVIHERVLWLYARFLEHKSKYGDESTKNVLSTISLVDFIDRLLKKRCVVFAGPGDDYYTLEGKQGSEYYEENPSISTDTVISYDELKLSPFLAISSHSEMINNGNRQNRGIVQHNKQLIERSGVIISMIGARFQRPGQMEYQDICVTENQNTLLNGYGPKSEKFNSFDEERQFNYRCVWNEFYEESAVMFNDCRPNRNRFLSISDGLFDSVVMKKRFSISFDILLLESQARAQQVNKMAFVHVVGFGLGVWEVADQQQEIFLRVFEQRLKYLADKLTNIGWVNFAWFQMSECGEIKNENTIKSQSNQNGIKILMSNRNPSDKLNEKEFPNSLLVVSYAGDGNALPGNEFWIEFLDTSSDPAAACSTLISELHNPHINSAMVSGSNLHIMSAQFGVCHISDYIRKLFPFNFN